MLEPNKKTQRFSRPINEGGSPQVRSESSGQAINNMFERNSDQDIVSQQGLDFLQNDQEQEVPQSNTSPAVTNQQFSPERNANNVATPKKDSSAANIRIDHSEVMGTIADTNHNTWLQFRAAQSMMQPPPQPQIVSPVAPKEQVQGLAKNPQVKHMAPIIGQLAQSTTIHKNIRTTLPNNLTAQQLLPTVNNRQDRHSMVIKANRENGQQPGQQMRQNVHLGGMYYIVTETGWDHRNQSKSYSPPINVTYSNNNYSAVVQRSPAAEDTRASPVTKQSSRERQYIQVMQANKKRESVSPEIMQVESQRIQQIQLLQRQQRQQKQRQQRQQQQRQKIQQFQRQQREQLQRQQREHIQRQKRESQQQVEQNPQQTGQRQSSISQRAQTHVIQTYPSTRIIQQQRTQLNHISPPLLVDSSQHHIVIPTHIPSSQSLPQNRPLDSSQLQHRSGQQSLPQEDLIVWKQRFFVVIQRYRLMHSRFDFIINEYIQFWRKFEGLKSLNEVSRLREKYQNLIKIFSETQQQLVLDLQLNQSSLSDNTDWKKQHDLLFREHEQLKKRMAELQNIEGTKEQQVMAKNLATLQSHIAELEANQVSRRDLLRQAEEEIGQLRNQNVQLGARIASKNQEQKHQSTESYQKWLNQNEIQLKQIAELKRIISLRNEEVSMLRKTVEARGIQKEVEPQIIQQKESFPSKSDIERSKRELNQRDQQIISSKEQYNALVENYKVTSATLTQIKQRVQQLSSQNESLQAQLEDKEKDMNNLKTYLQEQQKLLASREHNKSVISETKTSSEHSQDISILKEEIDRLRAELTKKKQISDAQAKANQARKEALEKQIANNRAERDSTIASLQNKNILLETELKKYDAAVLVLRENILNLQTQLSQRDEELRIKQSAIKGTRVNNDNQNLANAQQKQQRQTAQLTNLVIQRENELRFLQERVIQVETKFRELQEDMAHKNYEINSLRRALTEKGYMEQELNSLSDVLAKKNSEILSLKEASFEKEKFNKDNQLLAKQNERLTQLLRQKTDEISEISAKLSQTDKKARDLQMIKSPQIDELNETTRLLQEAIVKKDIEISKLRQNAQLLQTNIDELQFELEKAKGRLPNLEKANESEKTELKQRLTIMERKVSDYEKRITGYEEMSKILQEQTMNLTTELQLKIEAAQKSESETRGLKTRTKSLQGQNQDLLAEIELLNGRIKEITRKQNDMIKQQLAENDKQKELTNTKKAEIFNLNNKYIELESLSKNKDMKIKELERQVQDLQYRIRSFDGNMEQIQFLNSKINQYERKIQGLNFSNKVGIRPHNSQATTVFENKLIYELKTQNDALREQLGQGKRKGGLKTDDRSQNEVQRRLNEFNQKLQELIRDNNSLSEAPQTYNTDNSALLIKQFEREKRNLIDKHNNEIAQLKVKILQLNNPFTYAMNLSSFRFKNTSLNPESILNEQIDFYKEKNRELQELVDNHIRVNRQLKESLDNLMKGKSEDGNHSLAYYRQQVSALTETVNSLQAKLKKTTEDARKTRQQTMISSRRVNENQYSFDLQQKTNEFNRKLNQLTTENGLLEKNKTAMQLHIQQLEAEGKKLRALVDELNNSKDILSRMIKEKESNFEADLSKTVNKWKFSQAEIERLNQQLSKKNISDVGEANQLRSKISELQEELKKHKARIQEHIMEKQNYERDLARAQNNHKAQLNRLNQHRDEAELAFKRQKQEAERLRDNINVLEGEQRSLKSNSAIGDLKQVQYQQDIARFITQIKFMESEMIRINQLHLAKTKDKERELASLKEQIQDRNNRLALLQNDVSALNIHKAKTEQNDSDYNTLVFEMDKMKTAYQAKTNECEVKNDELYECKKRAAFELEQRQIDFNRIVDKMKMEYTLLYKQRAARMQDIDQQSAELRKLKGLLDEANTGRDRAIRTLQEKEFSYNSEISRLTNRLRYSEQEVQRLTESIATKSTDLTENRIYKNRIYELELQQTQYNEQLARLNTRICSLESDALRANETNSNRIREKEAEIAYLNLQITEKMTYIGAVENEINELKRHKNKSAVFDQVQAKLDQELAKGQLALQSLETQIIRKNQELEYRDRQISELLSDLGQLKTRIGQMQIELQASRGRSAELSAIQAQLQYHVEYLRSSFIELDALVDEIPLHEDWKEVYDQIKLNIVKSLRQCEQANALLIKMT